VTADVESARLEWEGAQRALSEAMLDSTRREQLSRQLETVASELRRRVGGTFTMRELVDEYARADVWVREALAEGAAPGWPRNLALVEGAAFHVYARGALDYAP
jgi:hypothetical protein